MTTTAPTPMELRMTKLRAATSAKDTNIKKAADTNTSPAVFTYLAGSTDVDVRRTVAANPAAPLRVLHNLARDADETVRTNTLWNHQSSLSVRRLARVRNQAAWSLANIR
jgi:hypothetical protein